MKKEIDLETRGNADQTSRLTLGARIQIRLTAKSRDKPIGGKVILRGGASSPKNLKERGFYNRS